MRRAVALLALLFTLPALAVEPSEVLSDPALEARARTIGQALRCVVCQNQSIDDSAAEVAHDMRRAVRERLTAGDSNDQVFAFMVARYGDYVLLKPPFKTGTLVLWLGAPLLFLGERNFGHVGTGLLGRARFFEKKTSARFAQLYTRRRGLQDGCSLTPRQPRVSP